MFTIENSNIYNSNNETKNKSAKYQEKEKMKKRKRNINSSTHSIFQDILESYANIVLNTRFQS